MIKIKTGAFTFLLLLLVISTNCKRLINSNLQYKTLPSKIRYFNAWFEKTAQNKYFKLGLANDGNFFVTAKQEIKAGEDLTIHTDVVLSSDVAFNEKNKAELEAVIDQHGYDEKAFLYIALIGEFFNPESKWRAYLDLVPFMVKSPALGYWDNSSWLEPELTGTLVLKKLVDYKIAVQRKAAMLFNLLIKNSKTFDHEIYNEENFEFAILLFDSRMKKIEER